MDYYVHFRQTPPTVGGNQNRSKRPAPSAPAPSSPLAELELAFLTLSNRMRLRAKPRQNTPHRFASSYKESRPRRQRKAKPNASHSSRVSSPPKDVVPSPSHKRRVFPGGTRGYPAGHET